MREIAIACPLYDMKNHFELALQLLESKRTHGISDPLYFVFSNIEQKSKFETLLGERLPTEKLNYLVLPEEYDDYKAKAVSKKFYALEMLKDKYDYIILTDCESKFIKGCCLYDLATYIWNERTMLASNISYDGFFIMRKCFLTLGIYNNSKLKKELENYKYNFWFNEIQVYKCDLLDGFFSWLNKHNRQNVYNQYYCFEYYVFYAYLLLQEDLHVRKYNYKSMGGINEYLVGFSDETGREILNKMDLHWSSNEKAITEKTVMLFHLDRESKDAYGYKYNFLDKLRLAILRHTYLIKDTFIKPKIK